MRVVKRSDLPPNIAAYFASTQEGSDELTLIIGSHYPHGEQSYHHGSERTITAAESAAITSAFLEEYSNSGERTVLPSEDVLLRPLPESDWEVLGACDRNPW